MLKFSIKNLLTRKAKFIMTAIAILVATLIILFTFNVAGQINDGIIGTATYYDVVIGSAGSSTDLVMSTMFFTGTSTDTIDSEIYEELKSNKNVKEVIPFATGDNYKSSQIVGTSAELLKEKALKNGNYFSEAFEIVVGYEVAKENNLNVGDKLVGSHGISESSHSHDESPYTIVGILDKTYTAYDNALFTTVDSVWKSHGIHDKHENEEHEGEEHNEESHEHSSGEYTAFLVKTTNPAAAFNLISNINEKGGVLAVNPSTVLRDLLDNIDIATKIVYVLCAVIGVMSFIIIYMITLMMMQDLKKDVTLMRLLGLKRKTIFGIIFIQNIIVILLGVVLAFVLTRISLILVNNITSTMGIVMNYTKVYPEEYLIVLAVIFVSLVPTILGLAKMFKRSLENEK